MAPLIEVSNEDLKAYDQLELKYTQRDDLENGSQATYTQKVDIVKSDYIKLGIENIEKNFDENKGFDIAIVRSEFSKNWEEQNISLLEKGLRMSNMPQYMEFHNSVWDAYKNNTQLFNAEGNKISSKVIKDLYRQVTRNEWTNLNAKFEKDNSGDWTTKEAAGLNKNKDVIYDSRKISVPIQDDCYVNPKNINEDGFPTEKSKKQKFKRGENIYFWVPREGTVARFYADGYGADLYCNRYPSDRYSALGVRAVVSPDKIK